MFQNFAPSGSICLLVLLVHMCLFTQPNATLPQLSSRIELNDPLRPFHCSTNCSWPLKTIESNGGTTQKPLMSMARDQKTFNGDGFLKKRWNLQWSLQNHWYFQCSPQTMKSCYLPYRFWCNGPTDNTLFPFMQACVSLQVEFTHFLLHWIFQTILL